MGTTQRKKKKRETKKHKPVTDLEIPDNPYPVYKMLINSEKYTKNELIDDVEHLSQADFRLEIHETKAQDNIGRGYTVDMQYLMLE